MAAVELEYYGPPGDRLPFPPDMQSWLRTRPASKQESPPDKQLEAAAATGLASAGASSLRQDVALV